MHISALCEEAFSIICELISHDDLFALLQVGNAQLTNKINVVCKALRCLVAPFVAFPFRAYRLPQLHLLEVFMREEYICLPLRLLSRPPLPPHALETLTTLKLVFSQSLDVLGLVDGVPLLERAFPNLQYLTLEQSYKSVTKEQLLALPRTLLSLKIDSGYNSRALRTTAPIHYDIIASLPRGLESIDIAFILLAPNPPTKRYENIAWPPNLKKLALCHAQSPQILHALPANLEYLDVRISDGSVVGQLKTSQLPKTLTHCVVTGALLGWFPLIPDGIFPSNLCTLSMDLKIQSANDLLGLPPSLTAFSGNAQLVKFDRLDLCPALKRIVIPRAEEPAKMLRMVFPQNLTVLGLCMTPSTVIPWNALPATLTQLMARVETVEQAAKIPRNVTSLDFAYDNDHRLPSQLFASLPQGLTELTCSLESMDSSECVRQLPNSLVELNLISAMAPDFAPENDSSLGKCFAHLTKLRSLNIECQENGDPHWRDWFIDFGDCLPQLEALEVSVENISEMAKLASNEFLKKLPKSLTRLSVPITSPILEDPHAFSHLPPHLLSLHFLPTFDYPIQVSNEQFSALPSSLTSLHLGSLYGVSNGIFDYLHATISDLELPSRVSKIAIAKYYDNPIWEGRSRFHGTI